MHRNQASVVCFILMKRDEIINSMGIIRMKQKKTSQFIRHCLNMMQTI